MSCLKCEKGSKEVQAGWPNHYEPYLLEAVTGHMKNTQITGDSQHGLCKDKSCLPIPPAFCVQCQTGNKGRARLLTKMLSSTGPSTDH